MKNHLAWQVISPTWSSPRSLRMELGSCCQSQRPRVMIGQIFTSTLRPCRQKNLKNLVMLLKPHHLPLLEQLQFHLWFQTVPHPLHLQMAAWVLPSPNFPCQSSSLKQLASRSEPLIFATTNSAQHQCAWAWKVAMLAQNDCCWPGRHITPGMVPHKKLWVMWVNSGQVQGVSSSSATWPHIADLKYSTEGLPCSCDGS